MNTKYGSNLKVVVDYALTRPEIEANRIAGFGYSLGGYLLARAAAFEHRLAALILDDGVHDLASGFADNLPPFVMKWVDEGHDEFAGHILSVLTAVSAIRRVAVVSSSRAFMAAFRSARRRGFSSGMGPTLPRLG